MSRDRILGALWFAGLIAASGMALSGTPLADRDFSSFWTAGALALSGEASTAYDGGMLLIHAKEQLGTARQAAFPYPPHTLFVFAPLALLPFVPAFLLWGALSAGLFWLAARPYLPKGFHGLLLVASPAALINLQFGQTGLLYAALWLYAFRFPLASAALTFKPHLGALAAIQTIRASAVVPVVAAFLALVLLSVIAFGAESWAVYFTNALPRQTEMLEGPAELAMWQGKMVTPLISYGYVGWPLFAVAAAWLLWRNFNVFTGATAALLISPYGFHYDMAVVCLGFGLMLYKDWDNLDSTQKVIAGLAFMSPLLVAFGSWLIPPILLAGLHVQCRSYSHSPNLAALSV